MKKSILTHWQNKLSLLLFTILINATLFAQDNYSVTGTVKGSSLDAPIPGVNVIIAGSNKGTITDFDGVYTIEVKENDVLEFTSLGFKTKVVIVSGQKTINVSLDDDTESLDEVIVVGYGTQKKKNLTGAISKVSGKKLENVSISRVDDALVGRVSGVQISATNPQAGGDPRITVRGVGSISGDSAPLIVVDGIALGTDADLLGTIDANNVSSIEVLKDASSVAIFGSRGANGVIIVTLKEGKPGQTSFSYNTYTGHKFVPENKGYTGSIGAWQNHLDNATASNNANPDDAIRADIQRKLDNGNARLAAAREIAKANGGETDWQDKIIPGGTITSHTFSATGGSKKSTFNASMGYLEDEGVLVDDNFKKYTGRLKVTSKSKNDKIKFSASISGAYTDQKRNTDFNGPLRQSPWLPTRLNEATLALVNKASSRGQIDFADAKVGDYALERMFDRVFTQDGADILRDANGNPILDTQRTSGGLSINTTGDNNALAKVAERNRTKEQTTLRGNASLEFKLLEGLKFKQSILGDTRSTIDRDLRGLLFHQNRSNNTRRNEQNRTNLHYGIESLLTYKKDFGGHSFDAVGGFSFDNYQFTNHQTIASGFTDDATEVISLANIDTDSFTQLGEDILVSYFGRLNYDYDDRYLLSLSARTDGSSRFGENTRYGFFPAASIGWRVSSERFLADSNIITDLKLRASYGLSGSNSINRNIFQSLYRPSNTLSTVSYNGITGVKAATIANPDLGWESLVEFNPGVDLEIANGLLGITLDYYTRTSKDLLLDLPIGSAFGVATSLQNVGKVRNTGFELELNSRIINKKNFSWNVNAILTTNENEVLDFGDTGQLISRIEDAKRPTEFITEVGGTISAFYGYVYDKEIPLQYIDNPFNVINGQNQQVYVKDINGDGILNSDDRTKLGDPYPDFTWSITNSFTVHNFDASFLVQGSHGAEVRVSDLEYLKNEFKSSNALDDDAGDPFGIRNVPNEEFIITRYFTSDHIQDASFVALRNINIGYTLPSSFTSKLNISKLRLYVTGENLVYLTADGYFGFNPEGAENFTSRNANTPITAGYQRAALPIARTISMGLNLNF